jgi:hypothetical protein
MELSSIRGEAEVAEAIAIEGVARKSHSTHAHGHHGGVERELPGEEQAKACRIRLTLKP